MSFISETEETKETREDNVEEKEVKLVGSQFGEASSRLLSARKNLLRKRYNLET